MIYAIAAIHAYLDALKEAMGHIDLSEDNRLVLRGNHEEALLECLPAWGRRSCRQWDGGWKEV